MSLASITIFENPELTTKELATDEKIHVNLCSQIVRRIKTAISAENNGIKVSKKMIMSPTSFMEKCFVRISWRNLYRRYRAVRIQALTECLAIVKNSSNKEESSILIMNKLIILGEAHKRSKEDSGK